MPARHDTAPAPRARGFGRAWLGASAAAAAGWAALVAASPPWFFLAAAPFCAGWIALSAVAAPPGLRARLAPRGFDLALGLATGLALYAASRAFLGAFCGGVSDALCGPMTSMFARFGTRGSALAAIVLGALAAPAEELFWRGVVQAWLERWLGPPASAAGLGAQRAGTLAAVGAAALAALVALASGEPFLALATVPTYAAWGLLAAWRGSLVPALVSHAVWSVLVAVVLPPGT